MTLSYELVGCLVCLSLLGCSDDSTPRTEGAQGGSGQGGSGAGGGGGSAPRSCSGEPKRSGEATFYDFADGSGNCGFDATPNDLMVAAMNQTDYAGSAACGACAHVVGPSGEVTVRIVDRCPECPQGNLDLSPEAFEKIAELGLGRVRIEWQYVPCAVTGPIRYRFKEGSNQWWTAIQLRNHRHAIEKLEYEKSGAFVAVDRLEYNYFVEASGMGAGPYRLRITDAYGQSLVDDGIALGDATEAAGAQQLPACAP